MILRTMVLPTLRKHTIHFWQISQMKNLKPSFVLLTVFLLMPSFNISSINSLGVPCLDKPWFARNIWDMIYFDNRVFVGCGNSSNDPPAPNAGPITVWTYQDGVGWQSEYKVDEEEISN